MDIEEAVKDPAFRREFVLHEIEGLKKVLEGNKNIAFHNDTKLSILGDIKDGQSLSTEDSELVQEHIDALTGLNKEISEQEPKLTRMIKIYEKSIGIESQETLKLA